MYGVVVPAADGRPPFTVMGYRCLAWPCINFSEGPGTVEFMFMKGAGGVQEPFASIKQLAAGEFAHIDRRSWQGEAAHEPALNALRGKGVAGLARLVRSDDWLMAQACLGGWEGARAWFHAVAAPRVGAVLNELGGEEESHPEGEKEEGARGLD